MPSITIEAISWGGIDVLNRILASVRQVHPLRAAAAFAAIWAFVKLMRTARRRLRTTRLTGPPSPSFVYGVGKDLMDAHDPGAIFERWAKEYGLVYEMPLTLGRRKIVLCGAKAIAHFYAKESWTYIHIPVAKAGLERGFGRGLLWSHGESHRRQRKSLNPAFSIGAVRKLTSIFYDSVYKVRPQVPSLAVLKFAKPGGRLDAIGLAGFSHDFGSLDGKPASVTEIFDTFSASPRSTVLHVSLSLLAEIIPLLTHLPTARTKLTIRLNHAMGEISKVLMDKTRKEIEMDATEDKEEKSIIGLLIKEAGVDSEFHLSQDEILAQMKLLFLAGYETVSNTLFLCSSMRPDSWALMELVRNPDVQTKLRNELFEHGADPTYDQLSDGLPYLDAIVHEVLRAHPPVLDSTRAIEDDVVPLSEPIRTKSGQLVDSLSISKGTFIAISMQSINRSAALWGEDAKVFNPSRWLDDEHGQNSIPAKAKEIQGHRHLLTFADGPRTCLGKTFALTEFKIVLSVLVKFVFEMRDGPEAKIELGRGVLPRLELAGEVGCKMPLRVRQFEG
ncbi:cytochrome P450 [Gyrodon lividus]|nr:cytochrome P450 [Gyrodon lividus]